MTQVDLATVESLCAGWVEQQHSADAAHDPGHVRRVVANCKQLTEKEGANARVTVPAAWLHDCVAVPKDSPDRARASTLAAQAATEFLSQNDFPPDLIGEVSHAIEAHSFSAGIEARTLEAKVVQDADRLDSLGAMGIARCLMVGGKLDRPLLSPDDPLCEKRLPDDSRYTVDHFYAKLFKLPDLMQTESGREMALERVGLMRRFLDDMRKEIEA